LIFETEVIEQRLRTGVLTYHGQQASENEDEQQVQTVFYTDVAANTSAHVLPLITRSLSAATPVIDIYLEIRVLRMINPVR
jgi:hypothetical protein